MENKPSVPDYDLLDTLELDSPAQVRAIGDELRTTILNLLHERAATVTELAEVIGRPKGTIAHHVKVLTEAGLLRVVRTRRVRAIEERFYGRTARMFYVGVGNTTGDDPLPLDFNDFELAARESAEAYKAHQLSAFTRHARLAPEQATEFWHRIKDLVQEFDGLPRSGDTTYGFTIGIFPVADYPILPPRSESSPA